MRRPDVGGEVGDRRSGIIDVEVEDHPLGFGGPLGPSALTRLQAWLTASRDRFTQALCDEEVRS